MLRLGRNIYWVLPRKLGQTAARYLILSPNLRYSGNRGMQDTPSETEPFVRARADTWEEDRGRRGEGGEVGEWQSKGKVRQ